MPKTTNTSKVECNDTLVEFLFHQAWRVWKTYDGKVPDYALEQLDQYGDWPRGLAATIMSRLSRDAALRKQLDACSDGI